MTISRAKKFIKRGLYDKNLRSQLLNAKDCASLTSILEKEDLLFSGKDFDEAFYNLLTQCQLHEQADQLKAFRMWWTMTLSFVQPKTAGGELCP